jgi:hypothetical protein
VAQVEEEDRQIVRAVVAWVEQALLVKEMLEEAVVGQAAH